MSQSRPRLSQRVSEIQESAIRKLDLVVRQQQGVRFHRLNIGQPDVPTPEPLLEAIAKFRPQVIAYGPAGGLPECREAAARYHSRWSPGLAWNEVSVTAGGSEGLLFAFTSVCDPGDDVIVPEPYYTNYNGFATVAGATVRPIPTRIEDGFRLPSDDVLDAALSPRTRAVVLANPSNPTGAIYTREEVGRLLAWAARHDLFVIADEVYRRIWFSAPPVSALEFPEHRERVIVIDSLSKTYSACGIRVGFLISRNAELMEKVERLAQARLGVQPLAQHVALTALALPEPYYEEVRLTYRARVDAMMDALSLLPDVVAPRPEGAFYSMVRLPVVDTERFARFLVEQFRSDGESVVVAPGPGFYADPSKGRNEVRLAAVSEVDVLRRAVALLGKGVEAFRRL